MKFVSLFLLSAALSLSSASVLVLDDDNYEAKTKGKTVFLKLFAPWCGHCKSMAADWERLANDWAGHETALVAEIDCTSDDSEGLCDRFRVEGFPTLLYGDPESPEDYRGGRGYDTLASFAKEFIDKPVCSVEKREYCSDEQKAVLDDVLSKSKDDLLKIEAEVQRKIKLEKKEMDEFSDYINAQFDAKNEEVNQKIKDLKDESNYKWILQALSRVHGIKIKPPSSDSDDDSSDDEDDDDADPAAINDEL